MKQKIGGIFGTTENKPTNSVLNLFLNKNGLSPTAIQTRVATPSPTTTTPEPQTGTTYTAKSGDSLWNIAERVYGDGSQYTKILDANKDKISNPNSIYAGQVLVIPSASDKASTSNTHTKTTTQNSGNTTTTPEPKTGTTYTVQSGDSLWNIAEKYYGDGSKYNLIYNANKDKISNPNSIYAGQVLAIPSASDKASTSNTHTKTTTQNSGNTTTTPSSVGTGEFSNRVGQRITDTSKYNNTAATGQCVWYVRGRAKEKLGKDTGAIGHANQMWYNAKSESKLSATADNIKPNSIISYKYGTGSSGQTYGHVIFIEDVVGDTVYYTEGGSGYYKSGTDGVVKTGSKSQILQGVNSAGSRIGSNAIGIIDLSKY